MTVCSCTNLPRIAPECICAPDADAVTSSLAAREAFLSERNAHLWLHTYNPRLDGVPAELILAGAGAGVAEEARRHCHA